jgi:universal stress protein A
MFRPKKILVPTDFSEYSDRALLQAIDIAKQYDAKVYLFHAVDDYVQQCVVDYCLDFAEVEQLKAEMMAKAKERIDGEIEKLPQAKEVDIIADIGHGNPYEAILHEEKEKGVDLIVLASLGRSGIAHIIIGSVARHILRGASCSVLLTK